MAAPIIESFDPLEEYAGVWTIGLAEKHLPRPDMSLTKYECLDGRLFLAPTEASSNSWGGLSLAILLRQAARPAGFYVYNSLNLTVSPQRWIQPDVCVLNRVPSADHSLWVPADYFTMAVEFVSPSSRRRDHIDKPRVCADAGVPYYMRVEIERRLGHVEVAVLSLADTGKYVTSAHAVAGQELSITEPFELSFDPAALLEP